jgi:hypothetical protein
VYERRRYGRSSVKKEPIKKALVKVRQVKKEQERRESAPEQETITTYELVKTEFGNQDELPNQDDDREVESVREIVVTNEEKEND